ncbi:MAG: hypothetical protein SFY66_28890 [Oculatellaceae cyanobacterium bins.114]|nr:hypothetical protein [Oculatellaceae cyanobacterium bins.114]
MRVLAAIAPALTTLVSVERLVLSESSGSQNAIGFSRRMDQVSAVTYHSRDRCLNETPKANLRASLVST